MADPADLSTILLRQHLADLWASGLSDDQIRLCKFRSESDPAKLGKWLGWSGPAKDLGPCLLIPFFDADGGPLGYARFKPDRPRTLDGKKVKYESPKGESNHAYLPPGTRGVLADPAVPLLLTEGEKKAAKADQEGFPCVGLVGVYGFQVKQTRDADGRAVGPRELIPELAAVAWDGRRIYIVYDSDLLAKPQVRSGERHLAEVLAAAGADVRLVRLPDGPGGVKQGLDDFLVAHGPNALRRLLDEALPFPAPPTDAGTASSMAAAFAPGDRVSPSDRKNVGTVTEDLGGGRYNVRFVGPDGVCVKAFAAADLRPVGGETGAAGVAPPPTPPRPYVPFPVEALPPTLRAFVEAVAAAVPCDPAAVALPVLATCGIAAGAARVQEIKRSWVEPPVIWGAVVARSGTVKSAPGELAVEPLVRLDLELRRASADALKKHRKEEAAHKKRDADRRRADKAKGHGRKDKSPAARDADPAALDDAFAAAGEPPGPPPPRRRCLAQDITIESLAIVLSENPKGVLIYRDELASFFGSLCRYSKTDTTADWLTLFHARTLTVDRKTGDKVTVAVPNAAAAVFGTIQPKVLARALTPEFRAAGGAARLLVVLPPARRKQWTEADVPPDVAAAYDRLIRRLRELEPEAGPDRTAPVPVRFTPEARARWAAFVDEWGYVTFEAGEEDEDLAAAYAKLEGYAARFALILHLAAVAAGDPGVAGDRVGLASLEAGITLAKWFANETERVYAALVEDEPARRLRDLAEVVRSRGGRVTVRDLQRHNGRRYRTAASAEAALGGLVAAGWGAWAEAADAGPSKREFVLGPTRDTSDTGAAGEDEAGPRAA